MAKTPKPIKHMFDKRGNYFASIHDDHSVKPVPKAPKQKPPLSVPRVDCGPVMRPVPRKYQK